MKKIKLTEVLKLSIELENAKREKETPKDKVRELQALGDGFVLASINNYQQYE